MITILTPATKTPQDGPVILLVDDQAFVAEVMRRFLASEENLLLHYCSNPNEAIEMANQIRPTVILQDLVMPGVDGLSVVSRFRANPATRNVPIIVLSSKEDPETKSLAFAVGANDYLVKLPEKLELVARVRYHSDAYLGQVQRDEAFRALRESQQQLLESNAALLATNQKLGESLSQVKQLRGLLPICSYCKRVREDGHYRNQLEAYLLQNSDLRLSHGICEQCLKTQVEALDAVEPAGTTAPPQRTGLTIAPAS